MEMDASWGLVTVSGTVGIGVAAFLAVPGICSASPGYVNPTQKNLNEYGDDARFPAGLPGRRQSSVSQYAVSPALLYGRREGGRHRASRTIFFTRRASRQGPHFLVSVAFGIAPFLGRTSQGGSTIEVYPAVIN
jgi:hypothetical protein